MRLPQCFHSVSLLMHSIYHIRCDVNVQDLSLHLSAMLPASWHAPGTQPAASGWDIPGAAPLPPSQRVAALGNRLLGGGSGGSGGGGGGGGVHRGLAGLGGAIGRARAAFGPAGTSDAGQQAHLGVAWREGAASAPTSRWLGGLAALLAGLVGQAPQWRDSSVRLSDLDGWPVLPVLPAMSGQPSSDGASNAGTGTSPAAMPMLVYAAHRAAVTALPPEFIDAIAAAGSSAMVVPAKSDVVNSSSGGASHTLHAGGAGGSDRAVDHHTAGLMMAGLLAGVQLGGGAHQPAAAADPAPGNAVSDDGSKPCLALSGLDPSSSAPRVSDLVSALR